MPRIGRPTVCGKRFPRFPRSAKPSLAGCYPSLAFSSLSVFPSPAISVVWVLPGAPPLRAKSHRYFPLIACFALSSRAASDCYSGVFDVFASTTTTSSSSCCRFFCALDRGPWLWWWEQTSPTPTLSRRCWTARDDAAYDLNKREPSDRRARAWRNLALLMLR